MSDTFPCRIISHLFKPIEFEGFKNRAGNLPQGDRLQRLNQIAIRQMRTLTAVPVRSLSVGAGKEGEV